VSAPLLVGLALYFDTITHFAILMLCLLLACGVYPLIDADANSQAGRGTFHSRINPPTSMVLTIE
jgi:hypothetical protein